MKRTLIIISLALFCFGLSAAVNATFSTKEILLNQLSVFTFDPVNPQDQPILTTLSITNGAEEQKVKIQVVLKWNNAVLIQPNQVVFITRQAMPPNGMITADNRDLITEGSSLDIQPFSNINVDLIEVMKNNPLMKEAALSGYFPDGEIKMEVSVKGENTANWDNTATFSIKIRNAGAIYPLSPGKVIGQVPPIVKDIPVSFLWNAINTGFNEQLIVIKEFPPNGPPSRSTVAQTGTDIYRTPEGGNAASGFSDYIPFTNKNYYAWRVYTPIFDQTNPIEIDKSPSQGNFLASDWFVFRYMADDVDAPSPDEVQALLNILGNAQLINFLNLGFTPTGEVIFEGRKYTGQDAIDILNSLVGKDIKVEIKN
ncbi:MAG: hypothetical protein LHW64_03850 [Candidatus Cloacimonetes bacterium]|jgi:hypothetical protein|nr:hypothetical protein [Candidatus Cloacimonadota bacterium]MCB5286919.1 hypothetical protein [Candidatus Cloacimonadota bacterium]MCK9184139.1 hypothetical protein [Candidatus Cloacimonadota bacterium]MCK9584368.1 hypothetical protein [Candidatus Cloacimonadota bacterium]MDY0229240.1 hypothetical protein [Candidatus Cloacimonadaceae bacterium]